MRPLLAQLTALRDQMSGPGKISDKALSIAVRIHPCPRPEFGYDTATRRAMAQPGSASVWGTEGRRFESC